MEDHNKSKETQDLDEKTIEELIERRKVLNKAFKKILLAINKDKQNNNFH